MYRNFKEYQKEEKNIFIKDFIMNLAAGAGMIVAGFIGVYLVIRYILLCIANPLWIFVGFVIGLIIAGIFGCWCSARDRQRKRYTAIKEAMDDQDYVNYWEEKLDKCITEKNNTFDEEELNKLNNEIVFAEKQIKYYIESRDSNMADYKKYGGKMNV